MSYIFDSSHNLQGRIRMKSFHTCTDDEGGSQLNLDITSYFENSSTVPVVLNEYKQLCTCINVPESVQQLDQWSINNHGNKLAAYFEPDCGESQWKKKIIPAGHSNSSRMMHAHQRKDNIAGAVSKVQSLGPLPHTIYLTRCNPNFLLTEVEMRTGSFKNPKSYRGHPGLIESCQANTNGNLVEFFSSPNFKGNILVSALKRECDACMTKFVTLTLQTHFIPPT